MAGPSPAPAVLMTPGTPVQWLLDDGEVGDYGTVFSVSDGGYGVIWVGDLTPKFVPADEVEPGAAGDIPQTRTRICAGITR